MLSGLYPVEFRDLFFGDMFCSLTYIFGNIELLFCLYAHGWNSSSSQCTSSGSMLFGFMTTLPAIQRALQCFRRYHDSGDVWPHLPNAGKYGCTVLFYMSLSLLRIYKSNEFMAVFLVFATINSVYVSIWDVIKDFSLVNVSRKKETTILRQQRLFPAYWYWLILIIDPMLRFNWILYAIFFGDVQHSSIISFSVALSEVIRRGAWALFRVENEQIGNNNELKAWREPTVPYEATAEEQAQANFEARSPVEARLRKVGSAMETAHARDYQRKPVQEAGEDESDDDEE